MYRHVWVVQQQTPPNPNPTMGCVEDQDRPMWQHICSGVLFLQKEAVLVELQ
jgi:hypothetical protein